MNVFWVLLGIVVLGGVAIVAAGRGDGLSDPQPDRADLTLPDDRPAAREDVDQLRFSVGLRGYRMDEVDDVLDRLAMDIASRYGLIGALREQLAEQQSGRPGTVASPEPVLTERLTVAEGAAMVGPVDVGVDPVTTRTLLVPLEQYEPSSPDWPGTAHERPDGPDGTDAAGDAADAGDTADAADPADSAGTGGTAGPADSGGSDRPADGAPGPGPGPANG